MEFGPSALHHFPQLKVIHKGFSYNMWTFYKAGHSMPTGHSYNTDKCRSHTLQLVILVYYYKLTEKKKSFSILIKAKKAWILKKWLVRLGFQPSAFLRQISPLPDISKHPNNCQHTLCVMFTVKILVARNVSWKKRENRKKQYSVQP